MVEQPVRVARFVARPARAFVTAAIVSGAVVLLAAGMSWQADRELDDPYLARLASARAGRSETGSANCEPVSLPSGTASCFYGDPDSDTTIVLVGDSHAAQWSPGLEAAADILGARLVVRSRGGCPAPRVFVAPRTGAQLASNACLTFRRETKALIDELQPDLVVVANARYGDRLLRSRAGGRVDAHEATTVAIHALVRYAAHLTESGIGVAVIQDNPSLSIDPIECLAKERSAVECSPRAATALPALEAFHDRERRALEGLGIDAILDPSRLLCDHDRCWVERDGTVNYADKDHLSRAFVIEQTPALGRFLSDALVRDDAAT